MIFVIIAAGMAALGFMILFVGFLATGATRYKVYRAWRSRVGGRISCAVLMGITYLLNFVWTLILCFLVIVTFIYTMFWNMCSSVEQSLSCIDLTQFRKCLLQKNLITELKFCLFLSIRFHVSSQHQARGYEGLRKIRNQGILQGWCGER